MKLRDIINNRLTQAITDHVFPGAVVGIVRPNQSPLVVAVGRHRYDADQGKASPAMAADTIFDVASITKAIPTSCVALWLLEHGQLRLDDRLVDSIPEYHGDYANNITVRHLLTQTLQFTTRLSTLKDKTAEEIWQILYQAPLGAPPGTTCHYSNLSSILLGEIITRRTGKTLDALADDTFFRLLDMSRTTFHPLDHFNINDIAPTEMTDWRGEHGDFVHGQTHDESAWILGQRSPVGSAGLFSTVPDLLTFIGMLLGGGTVGDHQFFTTEMIRQMYTNQTVHLSASGSNHAMPTGLGWELNQPQFMGSHCLPTTFGKTGFTGCCAVIDVTRSVGIVILSNRIHPHRPADATAMNSVRRDVCDAVWAHMDSAKP